MPSIKTFNSGDKIIGEGTFGTETFKINTGHVLICKETGDTAPFVLAELKDGEMFGEMYVFENAGFRTASAIAKSDVELEIIERQEIEAELDKTPAIIRNILMSLNKRLEGTSQEYSAKTIKIIRSNQRLTMIAVVLLCFVLGSQFYLMLR